MVRELLERTTELEQLEAALAAAVAGEGRLVVVSGEAGIGKSSLVRVFVRGGGGRVRVLAGACDDMASYGFFVPSMLALQSYGASWPVAEVESLVSLWTTLNWPRMVVGAAGWLCALRALSLSRSGTR